MSCRKLGFGKTPVGDHCVNVYTQKLGMLRYAFNTVCLKCNAPIVVGKHEIERSYLQELRSIWNIQFHGFEFWLYFALLKYVSNVSALYISYDSDSEYTLL